MTEAIVLQYRELPQGRVAELVFDLPEERVNKLTAAVMEQLAQHLETIKQSDVCAVLIRSGKPATFIAGADIDVIKNLRTREQFLEPITQAHQVLNTLEDLTVPTLAAIDGTCLGGGCELVLACDYRIATDTAATRIGLPEVKLGIFPGFGGCYRLPRLIGLPNSLDIILAGKALDASRAEKAGLVDAAVPPSLFEHSIEQWLAQLASGEKGKRRRYYQPRSLLDKALHTAPGRAIVFNKAEKNLQQQTRGFYPAPVAALQVIKATYGDLNRQRALQIEAEHFCDVAVGDVSKHLINLFFALEAVKKQTGVDSDQRADEVNHMGVLGAGVMGGGIAYVAADKGVLVTMKDIANEALLRGYRAASELWQKQIKRKRLKEFDYQQRLSHISASLDFRGFSRLDLVVEAVVEDMAIKQKVIAEAAAEMSADAIFATNTSSLSVTEMAEAHPHPENFVGMHFFNPVDKMPLVEVIRGEKTGDRATATVFALAKKMGKTPVVVKDGPGFLVNRLLFPLLAEALFLLEDGVDVAQLDKLYRDQFGLPMGPFRLMDEVGLDVCVKVLAIFRQSLGERVQTSPLMEKLAATERLGRKNQRGFYLYDAQGKEQDVDAAVYSELGLPSPDHSLSDQECLERGLLPMINEAARAVCEEQIVESAQACDLAMIMGTGFPPFRGGLLRYADTLGSAYIVAQLQQYREQYGQRFTPADSLLAMAEEQRGFYPADQ